MKPKKQQQEQQKSKLEHLQRYKELFPVLKTFGLWLVLISVVRIGVIYEKLATHLIIITGKVALVLCKITFIPVNFNFPMITIANYPMRIAPECTILDYYLFIIALFLFVPANWKHKLKYGAISFFILFFMNLLRFIIMGFIGRYKPNLFDVAHDYFWNLLFAFFVFILWFWQNSRIKPIVENEK